MHGDSVSTTKLLLFCILIEIIVRWIGFLLDQLQHIEVISHMQKRRRLEQILLSNGPSKYIVFCSTKRMCDQLAGYLDGPFGASVIHGDKSQMERDRVLSDFRSGKSPILVATDVAARGLDIKDIRFTQI